VGLLHQTSMDGRELMKVFLYSSVQQDGTLAIVPTFQHKCNVGKFRKIWEIAN
jgi:hypothetical protein